MSFQEYWDPAMILLCPKLRYSETKASFLYNGEDDPCKSGDCGHRGCHNYKQKYDGHLITPANSDGRRSE